MGGLIGQKPQGLFVPKPKPLLLVRNGKVLKVVKKPKIKRKGKL